MDMHADMGWFRKGWHGPQDTLRIFKPRARKNATLGQKTFYFFFQGWYVSIMQGIRKPQLAQQPAIAKRTFCQQPMAYIDCSVATCQMDIRGIIAQALAKAFRKISASCVYSLHIGLEPAIGL